MTQLGINPKYQYRSIFFRREYTKFFLDDFVALIDLWDMQFTLFHVQPFARMTLLVPFHFLQFVAVTLLQITWLEYFVDIFSLFRWYNKRKKITEIKTISKNGQDFF